MNIPTTDPAKRIAILLHRKLTTPWSDKEIRAYKKLVKAGCFKTFDDLAMIERRYKAQWPPDRDKNTLRHGLLAFLNGYPDEIDRASLWCDRHPEKPKPRKIIPIELPSDRPPLSAEEQASADRFMEQYRQRKQVKESA